MRWMTRRHVRAHGGAGPPRSYADAVDGMEVRSATGPCCAAVSGRRRIVVRDVASCRDFESFALFALSHHIFKSPQAHAGASVKRFDCLQSVFR